jgi:hypothetical protein
MSYSGKPYSLPVFQSLIQRFCASKISVEYSYPREAMFSAGRSIPHLAGNPLLSIP